MTDTALAQHTLRTTFPVNATRNVKAAIWEAFAALKRLERSLPTDVVRSRPRQWSERRVKAIWHGEARRIDHYEITDLEQVQLEQAKAEYRKLNADLHRLEAFLAAHGAREVGGEAHP